MQVPDLPGRKQEEVIHGFRWDYDVYLAEDRVFMLLRHFPPFKRNLVIFSPIWHFICKRRLDLCLFML